MLLLTTTLPFDGEHERGDALVCTTFSLRSHRHILAAADGEMTASVIALITSTAI